MASGLGPIGGSGVDPLLAAMSPTKPALRTVGGAGDGYVSVSDKSGGKAMAADASAASSLADVREASGQAIGALAGLSETVGAFTARNPVGDFGTVKIDGVATVLGAVDTRYMTERDAAGYVAGALNRNERNPVVATVTDDGKLQLRSKDGGPFTIEAIGALTTDQNAQAIDVGLVTGRYEGVATATAAISGPTFARERKAHAGGLDTTGGERRELASKAGPDEQAAAIARQAVAQEASRAQVIPARKAAAEGGLGALLEAPRPPTSVKAGDVELAAAQTRPGKVGRAPESAPLILDLVAAKADEAAGLAAGSHISRQTARNVLDWFVPGEGDAGPLEQALGAEAGAPPAGPAPGAVANSPASGRAPGTGASVSLPGQSPGPGANPSPPGAAWGGSPLAFEA